MTFKPVAGSPLELRPAPETLRRALDRAREGKATTATTVKKAAGQLGGVRQIDQLLPINVANVLAMTCLDRWVPHLFPNAKRPTKSVAGAEVYDPEGTWRVDPKDLGDSHAGLVEDLSIATQGIVDFGLHDQEGETRGGKRTPVDLMIVPYGETRDPVEAAKELVALIGVGGALRALAGSPEAVAREFRDVLRETDDSMTTPTWPAGTLPPEIETYSAHIARRTTACESVGKFAHLMALLAMVPQGVEIDILGDGKYTRGAALYSMMVGRSGSAKSAPLKLALNPLTEIEQTWGSEFKSAVGKFKANEERAEKIRKAADAEGKVRAKAAARASGKAVAAPVAAPETELEAGPCAEVPAEWLASSEPQKPVWRRRMVSDVTAEALGAVFAENEEGLMLYADELSGFIGSIDRYGAGSRGGSKDSSLYLSLYDGNMPPVDRLSRESIAARPAQLSILGTIQPKVLAPMLSDLGGDGLLQRFIPCVMGEPTLERDVSDIPPALPKAYEGVARRLIDLRLEHGPLRLRFSPAAMRVWQDADRWTRASGLGAAGSEAERGFVSKLPDTLARIALGLHLIEWANAAVDDDGLGLVNAAPPAAISAATVTRAWTWLKDFALLNVRAVYAMAGQAGRLESVQEVARFVKSHAAGGAKGFGVRDVYRSIRKYRDTAARGPMYSALLDWRRPDG